MVLLNLRRYSLQAQTTKCTTNTSYYITQIFYSRTTCLLLALSTSLSTKWPNLKDITKRREWK
uniref:Uncharacterized protein n=1 Tax=Meloidogyne enterolobii TaxID=390850 RepID=A0A6V7TK50_MELEN|nr:unnamed protein product [Meloidogyne enterolobii]